MCFACRSAGGRAAGGRVRNEATGVAQGASEAWRARTLASRYTLRGSLTVAEACHTAVFTVRPFDEFRSTSQLRVELGES